MKDRTYWLVLVLVTLGFGALGVACNELFAGARPDPVAVTQQACGYAEQLAASPAIQAEAERLGLSDVQQLVDLVCQSVDLLAVFQDARAQRISDPGLAVVAAMRGAQ